MQWHSGPRCPGSVDLAIRWQRQIGETCTSIARLLLPNTIVNKGKMHSATVPWCPASDRVDSWWMLHEDISHTAIPMWVGDGFPAFNLLTVFFATVLTTWRQWSTAFAKFLKGNGLQVSSFWVCIFRDCISSSDSGRLMCLMPCD